MAGIYNEVSSTRNEVSSAVPCYPDFTHLSLDLREEMHPLLSRTVDGVSEFTFSNLYLFRNRYQYRIARGPEGGLIISGTTPEYHGEQPVLAPAPGTRFFMIPGGFPGSGVLETLFETHDYWKNIPPSVLESSAGDTSVKELLEGQGIAITEDRDNFDYLYLRTELALLSGKKFHKKKNLVNAFMNAWPDHEQRPLTPDLIQDARMVLERWREDKGEEGDYAATREALELNAVLDMRGAVYYVDGRPVAFCLGEGVARGTIFAIHFEKGLDQYKGIYQYMNQAFAASLEPVFTHINREQDLGSEGLRQAKMTYRPAGFVKKYRGEQLKTGR